MLCPLSLFWCTDNILQPFVQQQAFQITAAQLLLYANSEQKQCTTELQLSKNTEPTPLTHVLRAHAEALLKLQKWNSHFSKL